MPIVNHTDYLDEKLYRRLIENVVMHITREANRPKKFLDEWNIRLRPLSQTDEDYFKHTVSTGGGKLNTGIPSGVTGDHVIDLFLHDEPKLRHFMENADRVQHEVCHALLFGSGMFVSGVHSKISPQGSCLKCFKINFWTNRWRFWQRVPINIIDIRDDLS